MQNTIKIPVWLSAILAGFAIFCYPVRQTLAFHQKITPYAIALGVFGILLIIYLYFKKFGLWPLLLINLGIAIFLFLRLSRPLALILVSTLLLCLILHGENKTLPWLNQSLLWLILWLYSLCATILQSHLISRVTLLALLFPFLTMMLVPILNRWLRRSVLLFLILVACNLFLLIHNFNLLQVLLYCLVLLIQTLTVKKALAVPAEAICSLLLVITFLPQL